ncbi:MAG TPA: hypothetical protein VEZ43_03660 [Dongiaceae bacterium]|nr:hypothetical protein [Dongiaceae bacterium]
MIDPTPYRRILHGGARLDAYRTAYTPLGCSVDIPKNDVSGT